MTIKEKLLKNCKACYNDCPGCNTGEIFLDLCELVELITDYEVVPSILLQQIIDRIGAEQDMTTIIERGQDDN